MAQSFDTVGWFARDPSTLTLVGRVLLPSPIEATKEPTHIIIPEDCFQLLGSPRNKLSEIFTSSVQNIYGCNVVNCRNLGDFVYNEVPSSRNIISKLPKNQVSVSYAMRSLQRLEFKANHGEWIDATKPKVGPGIAERVAEALAATDENINCWKTLRTELQAALTALLEDYGVLAIPTVPGPPPKLNLEASTLEDFHAKAFACSLLPDCLGFARLIFLLVCMIIFQLQFR